MGLPVSEVIISGTMASSGRKVSIKGATDIILGITAFLITIALHLQPVPTFWRIFKSKTTGQLLPFPYIFAFWNSVVWMMYSVSSEYESQTDDTFQNRCLFNSSIIGFFIEYIYLTTFRYFNPSPGYKRWAIYVSIHLTPLFMLSPMYLSGPSILALKATPLIAGIAILMYVSPVLTIIHVSRTKLVEYLPFSFLMALCLNGLAWTIYACLPQTLDRYLAISNGVGTVCAICLLGGSYFLRFKLQKSITSGGAHYKLE